MINTITITEIITFDSETGIIISSTKNVNTGAIEYVGGSDCGVTPALVAKVKAKTKKKPELSVDVMYDLILDDNKLMLSSQALEALGVITGDRISISYVEVIKNKGVQPVISKSDVFGGASSGNKLTKAGTVSFRGSQYATLSSFDTQFMFIPSEDGEYFILNPVNENSVKTITEDQLVPLDIDTKLDDNNEMLTTIFEENGFNSYASKDVPVSLPVNKEVISFSFDL